MADAGDILDQARLSIGAVSQATGIPVETLRTWERRYGFPMPERDDAGHRVYHVEVVDRLRLVHHALDMGHRPSHVVAAPVERLRCLLQAVAPAPTLAPPAAVDGGRDEEEHESDARRRDREEVARWLDACLRLDDQTLRTALEEAWLRRGALPFLQQLLAPFLEELGDAWFEGRIAVLHEHFASRHIGEFLRDQWEPQSALAHGPRAVCATLPGEYHAMGLHMVAVILSMAGFQVAYLDVGQDPSRILELAAQRGASYLLLSVSRASDRRALRESLRLLVDDMPPELTLVLGGEGAPGSFDDAICIGDLGRLARWAQREIHTP